MTEREMNIINNLTRKVSTLAVIILVVLLAACTSSNTVTASEIQSIANKLNCVCGSCDEILSECDCDTANKLTTIIEKGLSRSHSEEQIVQDLVQQYGQRVLVE